MTDLKEMEEKVRLCEIAVRNVEEKFRQIELQILPGYLSRITEKINEMEKKIKEMGP